MNPLYLHRDIHPLPQSRHVVLLQKPRTARENLPHFKWHCESGRKHRTEGEEKKKETRNKKEWELVFVG